MEVRGESGPVEDGTELVQIPSLAYEDEKSFPFLRTFDQYGLTVVNGRQAERLLIPELRRLRERTQAASARREIDDLLRLAEAVAADVHSYLWCIGD